MTTPSDPERGGPEIDLTKRGAHEPGADVPAPAEPPFDPYRFGKPDFPVPPEFAPPGYVPDPVPPSQGPPQYPGSPPPYVPPPYQSPYGAPPYGAPGQSPPGPPPYGSPYGAPPYGPPSQSPYGAMPPGYGYGPPPQTGSNGKAVTALVSGIASIVLCWLSFFDIVPVVLAVVFGFLALAESKRRNGAGKGMAVAGLVCAAVGAIIAIVLSVLIVRAYSHCGGAAGRNDPGFNQCVQDQL